MASTDGRRRPPKYPDELRERAVKMVLEVRQQTGERHGAVTRVTKELGIAPESLRGWVMSNSYGKRRTPRARRAETVAAQRLQQLGRTCATALSGWCPPTGRDDDGSARPTGSASHSRRRG
jgi:transposase